MREESIYKIVGWILLPITVLLALYGIITLFVMQNLIILIMDIVFVGTLMYLIRSIQFLRKNIIPNVQAKRSVGLGIRFSAFFAAFLVLNIIYLCVKVLSDQTVIKPAIDAAINMMQMHGVAISYAYLHQSFIIALWIELTYALLLLLHLLMSFLFLRRYRNLFEQEN